jgi:hypothetical protein
MQNYEDAAAQPGGDAAHDEAQTSNMADSSNALGEAIMVLADRNDELETRVTMLEKFVGLFNQEAEGYRRNKWNENFDRQYGQHEDMQRLMAVAKETDGSDLRDVIHDYVLKARDAAEAARAASAEGEVEPFDEDKTIGEFIGQHKSRFEKIRDVMTPKPAEASVEIEIEKKKPEDDGMSPLRRSLLKKK